MADAFQQLGILLPTLTWWPLLPGIQTRRAYPEQTAHCPHRAGFWVVGDEGKDVGFRAEVNAMAFLKGHARVGTVSIRCSWAWRRHLDTPDR